MAADKKNKSKTDINDCCKELEELKRSNYELFHKERLISIGKLSAGIVHEINNPLAFVSGNFMALIRYFNDIKPYLEYLENKLKEFLPEDLNEKILHEMENLREERSIDFILQDIQNIEKESRDGFSRIQTIISSLSEFSRFEPKDTHNAYNINEGLDRTLNVVWNKLKYVAEITRDYQEDLPEVYCVRNEISQVFMNILVNAAQAISGKGDGQKGYIRIRTRHEDGHVLISICDTGPGIPKNLVAHIFDPFFTTKETGEGTGLGLSISYDIIVTRHKGRIWVETEKDKGSCFHIELPLNMNLGRD